MLVKIIRFFSPPVFEGDEEKTRSAKLLNVIALSSMLGALFVVIVLPAPRRLYAFLAITILLGVWLAVRRGYVRTAAVAIVTGIALLLVVSTFTGGGLRATGYGAFTVLILFAGLLLGGKAAIGVTIFCILYGLFLYEAGSRGWLTSLYVPEILTYWIASSVYFAMTGVMLTLALQMIDRAMQRAKLEMEERQRASDEYHALFDNSLIGIYRSSVDGRMIEANQTLTRFNGYESKEEFLTSVTDIANEWYVQPGRREDFQRELEVHGRVTNFESEVYRHNTRERVWISENAQAVRDSTGKIVYYEGTVEDITPRKQIENDLRRRAEEMSLLYQISRVLTSGEDLYHILRDFVKELKRVMIVDAFHVGFYDAQTDLFTYSLFLNLDEDLQVPPRSLRENPGLTGEVISGKRTIYLPDVTDAQTKQQHRIVVVRDAGIRSYIGIPLMLKDRVIGVMSIQAAQADAYSTDHIRLLETLAAQVASTAEKGRLLDQLMKELEERTKIETSLRQRESMLEAVTFAAEQFLKTSDWHVNIDSVLENLGKTINVSHCYLFEHHLGEDGNEVSSLRYEWAAPGYTITVGSPVYQAHPIRSEPGTTDEILRRGETFVATASAFPAREKERLNALGIKALMEAPVFVDGRWWGTIGVDDMTMERDWSSAETDVIRAAANVLGAAIKRQLDEASLQTDLYERRQIEVSLRQRESILAVVAEAANRLLKASDWKPEIDSILENLGRVINATHAYLFENHLGEGGTSVTSMRFEWTAPDHPTDLGVALYQNVLLKEPNFETWYEVMSAGLPFIGDQQHLAEDDLHFLLARGMKALLDVPITVDGEWWGTIGFDDMDRARVWSNAEVDALLVAANILGTAIERRKVDQLLQDELTQRKQLIAELAAKNAELERFTYTVSHDLKSPLFTIRGFLGYLEKDLLDGDHARFKADAQRIAEATEKMQQLLNDLLELSRVGRLMNEPVEIPMNDLVRDVLALVEGQIQERGVDVRVQENLPIVYADRQRIMEVMQNLVDNAVKFMGARSNPRVEIGQAGEDNGMPVLFVRDNGIGISSDHFERVFGLFNKLDPKTEGTGIGLALVQRIIEFHGGRIWVESEPGIGSTFFFTLPTQPTLDSVI